MRRRRALGQALGLGPPDGRGLNIWLVGVRRGRWVVGPEVDRPAKGQPGRGGFLTDTLHEALVLENALWGSAAWEMAPLAVWRVGARWNLSRDGRRQILRWEHDTGRSFGPLPVGCM